MISESDVRRLVAQTVTSLLSSSSKPARAEHATVEHAHCARLVFDEDVRAVPEGGVLRIVPGARLTPLAIESARQRRITLVREPSPASTTAALKGKIALGADHGGFMLKESLKPYIAELGYEVFDLGTSGAEAVDYPDFAYAVSKAVADGSAWRGIMVDGAGIGSAMVANKVPGIRASMCYDVSSASNAREHNDANVLTMGGQLIGPNLARQIVKVWLGTEFGGGRHAKRVGKITSVESRYLKK